MTRKSKVVLLLGVTLFVITFSLYWKTRSYDFLDYDDNDYIYNCGAVTNGLSTHSIMWALGREPCRQTANWHPITTLSWMLDVTLLGLNSGAMHLHNAGIHALNSVLLFYFLLLVLNYMDCRGVACVNEKIESKEVLSVFDLSLSSYLAAFVGAAFWAWHPLRVESVAWVSSRKDVLSILFLLPGLMAYLKVIRGGDKLWLFVSGMCYLFAYCSKPTAVVFPLLAVMLEYILTRRISWRQNELLVYLMVFLMVVTFIVQDVGGATVMKIPLMVRLENAVAGLGHYVSAVLYPMTLSIYYKYEIPVSVPGFLLGSVFLIGVTWIFLDGILPVIKQYWYSRHDPTSMNRCMVKPIMLGTYGLLWFCLSLLPVSGLIQVGVAACADRYTYLSGIGLSLLLVVLVQQLYVKIEKCQTSMLRSSLTGIFCTFVSVALFSLGMLASSYIDQWENTKSVFLHASRVTKGNYLAFCNVGGELIKVGQYCEALEYFLESAKFMFAELEQKKLFTPYRDMIVTDMAIAFSALEGESVEKINRGVIVKKNVILTTNVKVEDPLAAKKFFAQGLYAYWKSLDSLAIQYFDGALKLAPQDDYLWRFKGYTLDRLGQKGEALAAFKRSYSLNPAKDVKRRIQELERFFATAEGKGHQ